jgi:phosphatidylserine/phosphatidylglycerophosphate/cardiolipin synthase-like enzyme
VIRIITLLFVISNSYNAHAVLDFDQLSDYYKRASWGTISPVEGPGRAIEKFKCNDRTRICRPTDKSTSHGLLNEMFNFNVKQFVQNSGANNFLEAKRKFYSRLPYSKKLGKHVHAYNYLSSWKSLFHPPVQRFTEHYSVYGDIFKPYSEEEMQDSPFFDPAFHHELDNLTSTEMTRGNKLKQLDNGTISIAEKIRMVDEAKRYFFSVVMVQYCDTYSTPYVDKLIEKAQQGVDVRVIVEGVWTKLILKKCLRKMRKGGVKVLLSRGFFSPKTLFTVMHDKFWIRDGQEAVIGGQNMHDFENGSTGFNDHTRDKDVHIQSGPVVTDLVAEYTKLWNYFSRGKDNSIYPYIKEAAVQKQKERDQGLRGTEKYADWLSDPVTRSNGLCRAIIQGDQTSRSLISKAYYHIINNIQHSAFINAPTFRFKEKKFDKVWGSKIVKAMINAGKRGAKIDLVSNAVDGGWGEAGFQIRRMARNLWADGRYNLSKMMFKLNKITAKKIGTKNRKFMKKFKSYHNLDTWEYFNHNHSKQKIFDRIMVSTGSFNLDAHSYKNHESTLICMDQKLANEALNGFKSDIVNSVPTL